MNSVYRGSWVTIVALSGTSANSGLPRISDQVEIAPQATWTIGQTRLLTVMPTLQQQCCRSTWATRAWTFQEATLSPRTLYFTSHQVYFECNSIQCCESIDEAGSFFHELPNDERERMFGCACLSESRKSFGRGVYRDPVIVDSHENALLKRRLQKYDDLIRTYSARSMTYQSDVLDACDALLQQLQTRYYREGFFWGLPTQSLPYVLLWHHSGLQCRRNGFPSWSWTGWEGLLGSCTSIDQEAYKLSDQYQPPFRAWKREGGRYKQIYESPGSHLHYRGLGHDKIYDLALAPRRRPHYDLNELSGLQIFALLFVETVIIGITVDQEAEDTTASALTITLSGISCLLECFNEQTKQQVKHRQSGSLRCALLDRNFHQHSSTWSYDLLLLEPAEIEPAALRRNTALTKGLLRRVGRLQLKVTNNRNPPFYYADKLRTVINSFCPRKEFVILV
jgi:Heterokaryon incompatibility protein (HET)